MTLLFLYLFLALGVSFLCSMTEATVLSLPRAHVAVLVKEGRRGGILLDNLKSNIERPLAAILTLNTIAHTIGAAGVGAQAQIIYGSRWVGLTSVVLTVLILVFSEIIPKTLGAIYAVPLASFTAYIIKGMILLTYPVVLILEAISRSLARSEAKRGLTREEFATMAELGRIEGALGLKEYRVIRNLLHLTTISVKDVMTPRTVVFMLDKKLTVGEAMEQLGPFRYGRMPVYGEGPDDICGIVLRHEIYEAFRQDRKQQTIESLCKPLHGVPEMVSISEALDQFIRRREHIFLVIDEYGGTAGIVTLEDAVETLLGEEIVDETDLAVDMRKLAGRLFESRLRRRL